MRRVLVCAVAAAAVAGCGGGDMSDLEAYVAEEKARKGPRLQPIPEIRPYEPYAYRPADRREPFTPFAERAGNERPRNVSDLAPDFDREREALEEFPLDALRMLGTLTIAGDRYALIRAPDGVVYRVRRGNHMGQNFGEIVAVAPGEVRLTEIVSDGMGGYMKRSASVALSE